MELFPKPLLNTSVHCVGEAELKISQLSAVVYMRHILDEDTVKVMLAKQQEQSTDQSEEPTEATPGAEQDAEAKAEKLSREALILQNMIESAEHDYRFCAASVFQAVKQPNVPVEEQDELYNSILCQLKDNLNQNQIKEMAKKVLVLDRSDPKPQNPESDSPIDSAES